jgi:hypothetical protein
MSKIPPYDAQTGLQFFKLVSCHILIFLAPQNKTYLPKIKKALNKSLVQGLDIF